MMHNREPLLIIASLTSGRFASIRLTRYAASLRAKSLTLSEATIGYPPAERYFLWKGSTFSSVGGVVTAASSALADDAPAKASTTATNRNRYVSVSSECMGNLSAFEVSDGRGCLAPSRVNIHKAPQKTQPVDAISGHAVRWNAGAVAVAWRGRNDVGRLIAAESNLPATAGNSR